MISGLAPAVGIGVGFFTVTRSLAAIDPVRRAEARCAGAVFTSR